MGACLADDVSAVEVAGAGPAHLSWPDQKLVRRLRRGSSQSCHPCVAPPGPAPLSATLHGGQPMGMLAERVDFVIGVDTHKRSHRAAYVNSVGGVVLETEVEATEGGYRRLLDGALAAAPGRRVWAVEGTGTYGAGLTAFLQSVGEAVGEVERPKRQRRHDGKSDAIDAVRAAREALGKRRLAEPRRRGLRDSVRLLLVTRREVVASRTRAYNQLHALVVSAPEQIRSRFLETSRRFHSGERLVKRCLGLRIRRQWPHELRIQLHVMRQTAQRVAALDAEASDYEAELRELMTSLAPELVAQPGLGVLARRLFRLLEALDKG